MSTETHTWPDLAIALYDKLTGRGAEIAYHFDQFEVHVPASTAPGAAQAQWRVNGAVRITTRDQQG
jgi:hypothetical protein